MLNPYPTKVDFFNSESFNELRPNKKTPCIFKKLIQENKDEKKGKTLFFLRPSYTT